MSSKRVYIAEEWGSHSPGFRARIREAIRDRLARERELSSEELRGLEDLSNPPGLSRGSLCISHCAALGGFAIGEGKGRVGLDVELASRVRREHAARVAAVGEVDPAPSPVHLWTAKEAAYKALCERSEPFYLNDVVIGNWGKARVAGLEQDADTFQGALAGANRTVTGLAFADGLCVIAICEASQGRAQA
jgi:hypothetical protein